MAVRVVLLRPGSAPETTVIEPDLATLKEIVGGYVDAWKLFGRVSIMFDEEGRSKGRPTCAFVEPIGDTVVGVALISAVDDTGEPRSLTDEEIARAMTLVTPQVFTTSGRGSA